MINVGIIGFGRIGAEHAGWLAKASGIRAAAACDPTPARRALAGSMGLKAVDSIEALLGEREIQAVLVSTPTSMHFRDAGLALARGKHVMIEKPIALNLQQAEELTAVAERAERVLSVFHNRRWDIDFLTARRAIDSGAFGHLINIESRISQWASCVGPAAPEWNPQWRNHAEFGGGGLYDWGSHLVDQLWQLMLPAKPVRVFAQLRGNVWSHDCDDLARVLIDFDHSAVGLIEINTTTAAPLPRWHIDGTLGSAESPHSLEYDTRTWAQLQFTPADGSPPRRLGLPSPGLTESDLWTQFARAIRGEAKPAVTPQSVLPTMRLLDAARASSVSGAAIDLSSL